MNAVPSQEKTLQVLIYEASSNLVPLVCGILLKGSSSKIKFNFLETDQGKYKQAENHCEEVKSFGSKMLTGVRLTKYPKKAFKDIDCAIILPQNFTENSDNPIDGKLYIYIGRALEEYTPKSVQVILFAQKSVNVISMAVSYFCPSIDPRRITGVSCHHELRAKQILAEKIGYPSTRIKKVYVWGTDHVDVKDSCLESDFDPTSDVEGSPCDIRIVELNEDHVTPKSSSKSETTISLKSQAKSSHITSRKYGPFQKTLLSRSDIVQTRNSLDSKSSVKICGFESGFCCTDVALVENKFECYAYDLWDIECAEVKYKTKYCAFNQYTKRDNDREMKRGCGDNKVNSTKCPPTEGKHKNLVDVIQDDAWIKEDLVNEVKELDKSCDIVTISYAISRHFHAVVHGSVEPLSMVVKSDGSYGVHEGLFFSLPVRVVNGEMRVVPDIGMDSITRRYIHTKSSALIRFVGKIPAPIEIGTKSNKNEEQLISSLIRDEESFEDIISSSSAEYSYISGVEKIRKFK